MPFDDAELDALLFFGREREREIIVANLLASRLTVLYGPSGVGKTSLLRAGVARQLRALADADVAVFSSWSQDPTDEIDASIAATADIDLYLILDQVEEYFLYHGGDAPFARRLPELVAGGARVNVILGIREDALAKLDFFKGRIPNLFSNYLRLDHLDRPAARQAILGPLERLNELWPSEERYAAEQALVEAVLDEVTTGQLEYGLIGRGIVKGRDEPPRIEAPFLQLVLERLWEVEEARGSHVLRVETLERLGGAETIVREHLERALASLDERQQELAAEIFDHLVTPSGMKIAHAVDDLAGYAGTNRNELDDVLSRLSRERIVRRVEDRAPDGRFEIFHDVLAGGVLAWRTAFEGQRALEHERTRRRRAVAIATASLLALAAVAAVALFALAQRSRAEEEARNARARELSAQAVASLDTDPQRALRSASEAARIEPTARAEDLLRRVLLEARQRWAARAEGAERAVAFLPERLVVPSSVHATERVVIGVDGAVRVYSMDGRPLRTMPVRGRSPLAFGDGYVLSTGGTSAYVQHLSTGALVRAIRLRGAVRAGAFGARGKLLALVAADEAGRERVSVFRVDDGRLVRRFPQRGMKSVAFSNDERGRFIAAGSADRSVRVWRLPDARLVRSFSAHNDDVVAVEFSPDDAMLATASKDGATRIWNLRTGGRTLFFPGHQNPVVALAWSPDGRFVADASLDRTSRILQVAGVEEGTLRATLRGHEAGVTAIAFSRDGTAAATIGADRAVRFWDARSEQLLEEVPSSSAEGSAVATYARRGRWIVRVSPKSISVVARGEPYFFYAADRPIRVARVAPFTPRMLIGDVRGALVVDINEGSEIPLHHRAAVNDAAFLGDGRFITASDDGWARLFARDGALIRHFDHGEPVLKVALGREGRFATATASGTVRIWHVGGRGLLLSGHDGTVTSISFDPTGARLLTAGMDGVARIWEASTGALQRELRGHALGASAAAFSPDRRHIATTSFDKQVRLWDASTGRLERELVGHFAAVNSVAFSPDGRWLVTTSALAAALWSTRTGMLFAYLRGHTTPVVRSAEFSPDGRRVLTAGDDATVRIYTCEVCGRLAELLALADRRLAAASSAR